MGSAHGLDKVMAGDDDARLATDDAFDTGEWRGFRR